MAVTQTIGGDPYTKGEWSALNDVDLAEDGNMYWAIFEYRGEDSSPSWVRLTQYDLTNEQAWDVVNSHNDLFGIEEK